MYYFAVLLKMDKTLKCEERQFHCDTCGKCFKKLWSLNRHLLAHFDIDVKPSRSATCEEQTTRKIIRISSSATSAMSRDQSEGRAADDTDEVRVTKKDLKEEPEVAMETSGGGKPSLPFISKKICKVCNRKRYSSDDLKIHEAYHKNDGYACHICHKVLSVYRDRFRHMKIHTGESILPCSFCNKLFIQKTDLERHMRLHTGERPYLCNVCGQGFTRLTIFNRHRMTHTGEKPFKCDQCGKSFSRPYILKNHLKQHEQK